MHRYGRTLQQPCSASGLESELPQLIQSMPSGMSSRAQRMLAGVPMPSSGTPPLSKSPDESVLKKRCSQIKACNHEPFEGRTPPLLQSLVCQISLARRHWSYLEGGGLPAPGGEAGHLLIRSCSLCTAALFIMACFQSYVRLLGPSLGAASHVC